MVNPGARSGIRQHVDELLLRFRSDASKLELMLGGGGKALYAAAPGWSTASSLVEIESAQSVWDFVLVRASADRVELDRAVRAVRDRLSPDALVCVASPIPIDELPGYELISSAEESLSVFRQSRDPFQSRTVATVVPIRIHDGHLEVFVQRRIAGGFEEPREMKLWEFPQGHLNIGEDPLVAAARELREEAGFFLGRVHGSPSQDFGMAEVSHPFAVVSTMTQSGHVSLAYVATVAATGDQLSALDSLGQWMLLQRLEVACRAGEVYELNVPLVAILASRESELEIWTAKESET